MPFNFKRSEQIPSIAHAKFMGLPVGTFAMCLALCGFLVWATAHWRYRLVLRDEPQVLGAPHMVFVVGFALAIGFLTYISEVTDRQIQSRGDESGGLRLEPAQILAIALFVVPATTAGFCSLFSIANAVFDSGPATVHQNSVIKIYGEPRREARKHYLVIKDWEPGRDIFTIDVSHATYLAYESGQINTITSHQGFLGHEWISLGT